ncbi:MAG TPA: hypothetical protein VFM61_08025 [Pseudidiomarina sp.]|nr:hypothetical protein [Pseudidiomarina sp.]
MSADHSSIPIAQCWRHCCESRSQVMTLLQTARKWAFSHYSVIRIGNYYWLSCARLDMPQPTHDLAHELRLNYPHVVQFIGIVERGQTIDIVLWYEHQLLVSMTINTSEVEQMWLIEQLREWTSDWEFSATTVLLTGSTASPLNRFMHENYTSAHWFTELPRRAPHRSAFLRKANAALPWQRRLRLWVTTVVATAVVVFVTWWFWPETQMSPPHFQTQEFEIVGIPLVALAQIRDDQYQANLIAGWQFQEATLHDGQWTIFMRATYGTLLELRQQTELTVSSDSQSTRLETRFKTPTTVTPQQLASDQAFARAQLETLLGDWGEQIQWQSRAAPASSFVRWHDYELQWRANAAGMDEKFADALQRLPGQLVQYRWLEQQQELTMTIRFYWLPRHFQEVET